MKYMLIATILLLTGCTTQLVSQCPTPSNDLLSPSGQLWQINGDPERAATVIPHNGEVLMNDRDRVERWQKWWEMCNKGA